MKTVIKFILAIVFSLASYSAFVTLTSHSAADGIVESMHAEFRNKGTLSDSNVENLKHAIFYFERSFDTQRDIMKWPDISKSPVFPYSVSEGAPFKIFEMAHYMALRNRDPELAISAINIGLDLIRYDETSRQLDGLIKEKGGSDQLQQKVQLICSEMSEQLVDLIAVEWLENHLEYLNFDQERWNKKSWEYSRLQDCMLNSGQQAYRYEILDEFSETPDSEFEYRSRLEGFLAEVTGGPSWLVEEVIRPILNDANRLKDVYAKKSDRLRLPASMELLRSLDIPLATEIACEAISVHGRADVYFLELLSRDTTPCLIDAIISKSQMDYVGATPALLERFNPTIDEFHGIMMLRVAKVFGSSFRLYRQDPIAMYLPKTFRSQGLEFYSQRVCSRNLTERVLALESLFLLGDDVTVAESLHKCHDWEDSKSSEFSISLARSFINSGHNRLQLAGEEWAESNGYQIVPQSSCIGITPYNCLGVK